VVDQPAQVARAGLDVALGPVQLVDGDAEAGGGGRHELHEAAGALVRAGLRLEAGLDARDGGDQQRV